MIAITWWAAILYGALGGLICEIVMTVIKRKKREGDRYKLIALEEENTELKERLNRAEGMLCQRREINDCLEKTIERLGGEKEELLKKYFEQLQTNITLAEGIMRCRDDS